MVLRNGPAANPRAGISRIAQSGQSSWGIARARAASSPGGSSGMARLGGAGAVADPVGGPEVWVQGAQEPAAGRGR